MPRKKETASEEMFTFFIGMDLDGDIQDLCIDGTKIDSENQDSLKIWKGKTLVAEIKSWVYWIQQQYKSQFSLAKQQHPSASDFWSPK